MVKTSIQTIGFKTAMSELGDVPRILPRVFDRAIQKAGSVYRDHTKRLKPVRGRNGSGYKAKGIPTDTGHMRRNIKKRKIQLMAAGVFTGKGTPAKYGFFVHEGTTRVPERPFFKWSLELGGLRKIDKIIIRASNKIP